MIACTPEILAQAGISFTIQTVETTGEYVLIRVRTDEKIPSGIHDTKVPAISREKFVLADAHGTELVLLQSSSQGEGPFDGIVDLAFPAVPGLDFSSPLTLASENARLTFKF